MKNFLLSPASLVMAGFFAVMLFLGQADLLAQETTTVTFTPIVEFGTLFDTIKTSIAPLVAGALGLGLAIWVARYVFSVIKSMGR
jgi:hypothetical protein